MVRQSPVTLRRVVVAFLLLTLAALIPMALLYVASIDRADSSGYAGQALMAGLIVVLVAVAAVLAVVVSTARSIRLTRAQ